MPEHREQLEPSGGPPTWGKWIVTLLFVGHFFAIFVAVTSAGSTQFPPPWMAARLNAYLTRPYLQLIFLTNPYRFFAPNVGAPGNFWFRIHYADGTTRWLEVPRREDYGPTERMPYQRYFAMTLQFEGQIDQTANPTDPSVRLLTPTGEIYLSSLIRHVAKTQGLSRADGSPNPVRTIQFYHVTHLILEPPQIREGYKTTDLRLYAPDYYGAFNADGQLLGRGPVTIRRRPVDDLAVHILTSDLYPLFREQPDADRLELMEQVGAPVPVRDLLLEHPFLADPDNAGPDLRSKIEEAVVGRTAR